MNAQVRSRLWLGLLGDFLGLCVWFAFCLRSGIRACLVDQPQLTPLLWSDTLLVFFLGLESLVAISIAVVGLAIGVFTRLKPLLSLATLFCTRSFWGPQRFVCRRPSLSGLPRYRERSCCG